MKQENKEELFAIVVGTIIVALLILFGFIIGYKKGLRESCFEAEEGLATEENTDSRIEIIEERVIPGSYFNYYIIVDRATDVTYLMVGDNHGVGITELRESGGTVKLRE